MKGRKALFLTNKKYIDPSSPEGGVKFCTQEYIDLIETKFEIILFPVQLKSSFIYRFKKKAGLSAYEEYKVSKYERQLKDVIKENNIQYVFLNLTNTITYSKLIKELCPSVKIVLCSHGNESGDFLHEMVLHKKQYGFKKIAAQYLLGKMLSTESTYRKYIDLVLTVSDVELNIEKWLGSENVYMVARTITGDMIDHHPAKGRIGFFADLSHVPNYYGIIRICNELKKLNTSEIELRLVGGQKIIGKSLEDEFSFLSYLGYLAEKELQEEMSTWTFSLNPVFYYSRGVSTKLGKSLRWGLPVITTTKGMRGYKWRQGEILNCDTAKEMATLIMQHANNIESSFFYRNEILKMKASSPSREQMMNEICDIMKIYN